jgi:hypothetical protein
MRSNTIDMKILTLSAFLIFIVATSAYTQISGRIADSRDSTTIPTATVVLKNVHDSADVQITFTDVNGKFSFGRLKGREYKVKASYLSFQDTTQNIFVDNAPVDMGTIYLYKTVNDLQSVVITGQAPSAVQKGDTTEMNASAYKVNPDASAHELIEKMPGITVENGVVKANGEEIKRITIDGKTFFGDDVAMALKNLPAEVIDKIQVFNKVSDQAQFSGFNDGQTSKVINIVTRPDRRNGTNGNVSTGQDFKGDYTVGGKVNTSDGDRRIAITALSNNINQQNFTTQDMLGVLGGTPGGNSYVSRPAGVSTTHMVAANYSNNIGKKGTVSASYSFNNQNNLTESLLNREYMYAPKPNQFYDQEKTATSENYNHRFDMKLEYTIDSANSLVFAPRITTQNNNGQSNNHAFKYYALDNPLNRTSNIFANQGDAYSFSGDLAIRHKFAKKGRTVALSMLFTGNNQHSDDQQRTQYQYFGKTFRTDSVDLQITSETEALKYSYSLTYTEPIGLNAMLQFNYTSSVSTGTLDKYAWNQLKTPVQMDSAQSSVYKNDYKTDRAGASYSLRKNDRLQVTIGIECQIAGLNGNQTLPRHGEVDKRFVNVLPNSLLNYKLSPKSNFKVQYKTSITEPSMYQLQSTINGTNLMYLSTGNPDLKPVYGHLLSTEYKSSNPKKMTNFNVRLTGGLTQNSIGNSTFIADDNDTIILNRIYLKPHAQVTMPINIDRSAWNINSSMSYGIQIKPVRCNINLNTAMGYSNTPRYINKILNITNAYNAMGEMSVTSNISANVDFTAKYTVNYRLTGYSVQSSLNQSSWTHAVSFRSNFTLWKGFIIQSSIIDQINRGMAGGYDKAYLIWDLALGKKFFKRKNGEVKLSMYDVLNSSDNTNYYASDAYIESSNSNTFRRHLMLTVTYTIRAYKKAGGAKKG